MTDREPTDDAELAALYREGDVDLEPPPGLSSVRDLIGAARASGFDEEPPAHLDALLLAAARRHAPAPRRPWWRRASDWLRPVVLHPALAAGMALLAVGVAAGVMYERGRVQVAQPSVRPPSAGPARHAPVPPRGPDDAVARDGAATPVGEAAAPATEAVATERELTASPVEPTAVGPRRPPKPVGGAGTKARVTAGDAPAAGGPGRGAGFAGTSEVVVADENDALPPPPPPPPRDPDAPVEDRQAASAPATRLPEAGEAPVKATGSVELREQLLREAQTAARRGDCATVKAVAKKAAALDPAFYRVAFERDRDVAPCLAAPSK
jgi:hypothetical protein